MSTQLVNVEPKQVVKWEDVPTDLLDDHGFDNMSVADIAVPRLILAQSGSPAVKKSSEFHMEGLSEGDFYNSITKQIYGPEIRIVPVAFTKNRMLYVDNMIDCRSENGETGGTHSPLCSACEYSQWGTGNDGKGTACTEFKNYVCFIPEDGTYALFSFKRGSIRISEQFNATLQSKKHIVRGVQRTLPMFTSLVLLTSTPKSQGQYSWFALGYRWLEFITDKALLTDLKKQQSYFMSIGPLGGNEFGE